jgi:D-proline reductase (dithiol) PrdB
MAIEISRYCIPWTPFRKALEEATVMLISTAAVHHKDDTPFNVDGDLSWRVIDSATPVGDLRVADAHYDHACVDVDINSVFPLDRLHELRDSRRIAAVAEKHFTTGFTADLRRFRDETVPAVMNEVVKQRPDAVILTGG